MGLIGKNLSTATSAISNPQSYVTQLLNKTGVGSLITNSGLLNQATGAMSGLLRSASSTAANMLKSVDLSSVANNVSDAVKSIFGDSTDKIMANLQTGVPDSLASGLSKVIPNGGTFLSNPINSAMDSLNLGSIAQMAANELSKLDSSGIDAIASRLGMEIPENDAALGDLMKAAGDALRSTGISGVFSGLSSEMISKLGPMVSNLNVSSTGADTMISQLSGFLNTVSSNFSSSSGVTSTGLSSFFTAGLPSYTNSTGSPISGVPSTTNPALMTGLTGIAKNTGVSFSGWGEGIDYSTRQNTFNAGVGLSAQNGIGSALTSFSGSPMFNGSSKSLLNSLLPSIVGSGNAQMANQVIGLVGGGNVGGKSSIVKTLISNPELVSTAVGAVSGIMQEFGIDTEGLFGTGDKLGQNIIWNAPGIRNANQPIANGIGNPGIIRLTSGTQMSSYPDGTVISWQ